MKKKEVCLKVIAAACIAKTEADKVDNKVRMVMKIQGPNGEQEVFGFMFDRLSSLDSCIATLERLREEFLATDEKPHPSMSNPTSGHKH